MLSIHLLEWKRVGLQMNLAQIKDVLTRPPTHRASRIEELLPHRWQTTDI